MYAAVNMNTNVVLDESRVSLLKRLTHSPSKRAAVVLAVEEQIRREKLKDLAGLLGRLQLDEEAVQAVRAAEQQEAEELYTLDQEPRP